MTLRVVTLIVVGAVQFACSSGSGSGPATVQERPPACVAYATQMEKCVQGDRARVERALAWLQTSPTDPATAARQEEVCTREAARLRAACK